MTPAAGRLFRPENEKGPNADPYVVLAYDFWRTRFRSDEGLIGRTLRINGLPYTVLGVAPRGFRGTELFLTPDVWIPVTMAAQVERFNWIAVRGAQNAWMMVRLKPGVTEPQAVSDLNRVVAQLAAEYPRSVSAQKLDLVKPGLLGPELRGPVEQFVTGVMLVAALLLLAACTNLAALLGARSMDRAREIALRVSIGAGRGRIFRQLLTESIVLTGLGGGLGCAVGWVLLVALSRWRPPFEIPVQANVAPDQRVLVFAVTLSVLAGLAAGLLPARQAWRTHPADAIKGVKRRSGLRWPIREAILVVQMAVCGALVLASLVSVQSLYRTFAVRPGFDLAGLSVVSFDPGMARYSPEEITRFQKRTMEEAQRLPGVVFAAFAKSIPLTTDQSHTTVFAEDAVERLPHQGRRVTFYNVSPNYFRTMGTRVLSGREFDWRDTADAPAVVIVNETLARQFFGTVNAVGRRFRAPGNTFSEVIGVVEDGKYFSIAEAPKPVIFQSILRVGDSETVLVARSVRPEMSTAADMAAMVKRFDPSIPVYGVGSAAELIAVAYLPARVSFVALSAFGMLALMLAVTGIYGLASYSVARRTRDIGIRRALGAGHGRVLRIVFGRLTVLVATGSLAGVLLGLSLRRVLSALVFQPSPDHPVIVAALIAVMLIVALLSALGPMRRMMAVDPLQVLRQE